MAFQHGIVIQETATALQPLIEADNVTVAIGVAPLHTTTTPAKVNEPVLCNSMNDFVKYFGWHTNHDRYTLCEAADVFFNIYNVRPLICINVLDLTKHIKNGSRTLTGLSNAQTWSSTFLLDTVVATSGTTTLVKKTDYTLTRSGMKVTFKLTTAGKKKVTNDTVNLTGKSVDTSKIKLGTFTGASGEQTGIHAIEKIYPRYGVVPGIIIAPLYSRFLSIALGMASKAASINGIFKAIAIGDITAKGVTDYSAVNAYKTSKNLVNEYLIECWPMVKFGSKKYHMSTHLAALMNRVDEGNEQIPYESPSNKTLLINDMCLADKTAVYLTRPRANTLNSKGIVTGLNWNGLRAWGNYTTIYPSSTDPKDHFIPCRRMMNWLGNTLALSFFSRIDNPMNKRLVESVIDEVQIFLNGLTAKGALLPGSRIQFIESENPVTDLIAGKIKFHLGVGLLVPAQVITFVLEFDAELMKSLLS